MEITHGPSDRHSWKRSTKLGESRIAASVKGDKIKHVPHKVASVVQRPKKVFTQHETTRKPTISPGSASMGLSGAINMIDTADREANAYTKDTYANSGTYVYGGENEPGKRIPKVGAFAEAGVGLARAEYSVFDAEARGPVASACAEASATGVRAMAGASVGSASASAGPVHLKLGLGVETGVAAGVEGVEVRFLGTGFRLGPSPSISFLGSEISFG